MSVKLDQICRLCLKVTKNEWNYVDETVKLMLDILMLKLDLDKTSDPLVCQGCLEVVKMCLDFKYTCVNTERDILSFAIATKKVKHDIKVICREGADVEAAVAKYFNICRFCITRYGSNDFVSLNIFMKDTAFGTLSGYLPEMDFNIIENPRICRNCREMVESYFRLVLNCLDIEGKINIYCKEEISDSMYQVGIESSSGLIKQEELVIKEEETDEYIYQQRFPAKTVKDGGGSKSQQYKGQVFVKKDVSEIKTFTCSLCAYRAKYKSDLERHKLIHKDISEVEMLRCPRCTNEYKSKNGLKTHMLVHKDVSEIKIFTCSLCAYKTKYKSSLNTHMLIHKDVSEIEMFTCSICAYKTRYKSRLKTHMRVHEDVSEIKMFKCSLCTYETNHKNYLTTHTLLHEDVSEIKMFKCALCVNEYKYKRSLQTHMLVHKDASDIKMFKCFLCAFETKYKSSLAQHMLIHKNPSEITLFKCLLCTYVTKRKSDLTKHNMLVHIMDVSEIKMYTCSLCAFKSKHKCNLTKHLMVVHRDVS